MNPGDIVEVGSLGVALPIALLAGLISFLSPCVLPLVPGYLGYLGGTVSGVDENGKSVRGRLLLGVLLFIAGFTLVFTFVIVLSGALGVFFLQYQDIITRVLGVIVILMGLVFLGLFSRAQRTYRPAMRQKAGLVGAPLLGIAMGVGWAPCIGPTLGTIMTIAYTQADPGRAILLAIAYSLGLGIPFILLALGFGWASRSVTFLKKHIRTINIIGGVMLIVLGVLMVTGLWTTLMSMLTGVIGSVQLPL